MGNAEPQWLYRGDQLTEVPDGAVEMVYRIVVSPTERAYIGRKGFWRTRTIPPLKGRRRRRVVRRESDWREYWGSSAALAEELREFGKRDCVREVLHIVPMKSAAAYLEVYEQLTRDGGAFLHDAGGRYLNAIVNCRIPRSDALTAWLREYRAAGGF